MANKTKAPKVNNFVAKHMNTFNKPATHRDRTKYTRKNKHKGAW